MIAALEIEQRLKAAFPDAEVVLEDLTGGQDHWKALIITEAFSGLTLIARHRKVNQALAEELKGPIHALTLVTLAPGEPRQ